MAPPFRQGRERQLESGQCESQVQPERRRQPESEHGRSSGNFSKEGFIGALFPLQNSAIRLSSWRSQLTGWQS